MSFPNSLMHLLVCHSASPRAADNIIPALLDRGVGCYVGWTKLVCTTYGDPAAMMLFEQLRDGVAVAETIVSIQAAGYSPDQNTGAALKAFGNDGMRI